MPFSKHIDFGPDKMEIAVGKRNQASIQLSPEWAGTLMYGPLAMTATGVNCWQEASLTINSDLSNIKLNGAGNGPGGSDGNLYTLTVGDKFFEPDYYTEHHSTHYFRINIPKKENKNTDNLFTTVKVDKTSLAEVITLALERKKSQEAWNALTIKVPEYSPWAPHAFGRLMIQLNKAEEVYLNKNRVYTQSEVYAETSALNAAINTMRPSNLPEPEDLQPLLNLLEEARKLETSKKTPTLTKAIDYAEMIVAYVNDGSGTHDMIVNATERIEDVLK